MATSGGEAGTPSTQAEKHSSDSGSRGSDFFTSQPQCLLCEKELSFPASFLQSRRSSLAISKQHANHHGGSEALRCPHCTKHNPGPEQKTNKEPSLAFEPGLVAAEAQHSEIEPAARQDKAVLGETFRATSPSPLILPARLRFHHSLQATWQTPKPQGPVRDRDAA
ncbi:hypothetical protein H920_15005 [Fukomys damarensis]|uniref:Uncharacterized protein n=1 Tax=Fukomys damarensis TaxID=885580 RepID=A0A091DLY1_FUKDA|nr:hypothetical protein H920_15005 [Fukomys damarensis]